MGARDTDPVEITIASGILLLGLPQDARLARVGGTDPQTMIARLREARITLHDPMIAGQWRRLVSRAQVHIPTGLDNIDALIDATGVALVHKTILGVFLSRAPMGPPVAAPAPKPAPSGAPAFAGMSADQRIRLLLERTPKVLAPDLARSFRSMVTVEALAGIAAAFVVLLAAQFVGVGEIADAALGWWAYSQAGFSGLAGLYEVLRAVVAAVRATDEGAFDQAVKRFAEGLTLVGVALLTVVVARAARKRAGGAEGGGSDAASGFGRPKPEPTRQRWPIAPAAPKAEPTAVAETEQLSPFSQRYLTESGGRFGGPATRAQNYRLAQDLQSDGYSITGGGGMRSEEYIAGAGPGTTGSTFVDITAKAADGSIVRVQTIDTLPDGITPTPREAAAAARIRAAFPNDELRLIPKAP